MQDYPLKNIDYFDSANFIKRVERSSNIRLDENELSTLATVGELSIHIVNKIKLEDRNDCTSQQAFYKLRESVSEVLQIDKKSIDPQMLLTDLLPKHNRRLWIKKIETSLGFNLNILRPPYWLSAVLAITLIASLIGK